MSEHAIFDRYQSIIPDLDQLTIYGKQLCLKHFG